MLKKNWCCWRCPRSGLDWLAVIGPALNRLSVRFLTLRVWMSPSTSCKMATGVKCPNAACKKGLVYWRVMTDYGPCNSDYKYDTHSKPCPACLGKETITKSRYKVIVANWKRESKLEEENKKIAIWFEQQQQKLNARMGQKIQSAKKRLALKILPQ